MPSRRRLARIAVMQTLFELQFPAPSSKGEPEAVLRRNIGEQEEPADAPFAQALLAGVFRHSGDILSIMSEHAPQWPLERMDRITRCILMIGTEEILFVREAPPAVVMNEAIEMAKDFGGAESGKFVNGVLNAIAHGEHGSR